MRSLEVPVTHIYDLIITPPPHRVDELKEHMDVLSKHSEINSWPAPNSPSENAIFWCSVYHYVNPNQDIVNLLKRTLNGYLYIALTSLVSLISSTLKWLEFNPEGVRNEETITQLHLPELMQHPQLAYFLSNYIEIVLNESSRRILHLQQILEKQEITIKTLTSSKERAEQQSASKSQFLANMSHEIRQPMNGVLGMAHLLKQTTLSEEQWEYVKAITQSGETLLNIVNDILDISKAEKNLLQLEPIPFAVRACLVDTIAMFTAPARQKRIAITSSIDPAVPDVIVQDKSRVRQVLFNLIGNAVKFTSEQGKVEVTLSRVGDNNITINNNNSGKQIMLEFCVSDTGCGIPEDFKSRLFEPFCQFFKTSRGAGTGLGLAISQNLVRLMQGSIWFESEPNKGSQFYFTIAAGITEGETPPLLPKEEETSNNSPREFPTPAMNLISNKKYRVLVVDDNPINLRVMTKMLHKIGQEDVHTAGNGAEALIALEERDFDIIFMDVYLGEMDGMEVTRRIHKNMALTQRKCPAVIAVSASAFMEDREKCLNAGMQDFLPKPVKLEQVAVLLHKWGSAP